MNKKVYLAGPDVFRPNALDNFNNMSNVLKINGFEPLIPIDNNLNFHHEIFKSNVDKIFNCNYVLANLDPFRGVSADAGTCIEIGIAYSLNKKIIGYYTNGFPLTYQDRVKSHYLLSKYTMVEDFNLTDNLMIINACSSIFHNFHSAVKFIWSLENDGENENRNIN